VSTPSRVPFDFHTFSEQQQAEVLASGFDPDVIEAARQRGVSWKGSMSRLQRSVVWDGTGKRPVPQEPAANPPEKEESNVARRGSGVRRTTATRAKAPAKTSSKRIGGRVAPSAKAVRKIKAPTNA